MKKIIKKLYERENEVWLPIKCYDIKPNTYEASSCGNVRRIKDKYPIKQQILHNEFSVYKIIHLQTIYSGRKTKNFLVHRIIAKTFFVGIPYNATQVNHKDNNGLNNCIYNLEWVTSEYNSNYIYNYNPLNPYGFSNVQIYNIYLMIANNDSNDDIIYKLQLPNNYISIDFINRIRISYINNLPPVYDYSNRNHNNSLYSSADIHLMCRYLEQGKNLIEIANLMNIDISTKDKISRFSNYIRLIKRKATFAEISEKYNF